MTDNFIFWSVNSHTIDPHTHKNIKMCKVLGWICTICEYILVFLRSIYCSCPHFSHALRAEYAISYVFFYRLNIFRRTKSASPLRINRGALLMSICWYIWTGFDKRTRDATRRSTRIDGAQRTLYFSNWSPLPLCNIDRRTAWLIAALSIRSACVWHCVGGFCSYRVLCMCLLCFGKTWF